MNMAAVYRRVSTPSQVDGFSLDTQLEQLSQLAETAGYMWEDFCDPGISGEKLEERPALVDLLSRLDEFDAVLVVDESRLARDELVAAVIRDHLRRASVKLITPSGETDLTDPLGSLTSGLLALVNQYEQQLRRAKMITGLEATARAGYWTGGPAPHGYRPASTDDGHTTLAVYEPEAEFLRTAVSLIVDEGLSPYEACKKLKALGYRSRSGKPWGHRNLRGQLIRRHLVGEIPYTTGDKKIVRRFPPIISEERFDQLQTALARRYRGPKSKHRTYPLSGRLQCRCGQANLVGVYRNDRDARYYMCPRNASSAVTGDKCPIHPRQQRAEPIEDTIWAAIAQTLSDPTRLRKAASDWFAQQAQAIPDRARQSEALQARLEAIEAERVRTFRDGGRLGLTDHEVSQLLDQLAEERQQIEDQLAMIRPPSVHPDETDADELERLIMANIRLQASDENTRAEILDLLDVAVQASETGYTVQGTIPLDPGAAGNIETPALPIHGPRQPRSGRDAWPELS